MNETAKSTSKKRGRWIWTLIIVGILAAPFMLFYLVSVEANHTKISSEQAKMPARLIAAAPTPVAIEDSGRIVARRVRAARKVSNGMAAEDYDEFLKEELQERPELTGAKQYLDLNRRWSDKEQRKIFDSFDSESPLRGYNWIPGKPLPRATADWLTAHSDIVGQVLAFGEGPGLPARSIEMLLRDDDHNPTSIPNRTLLAVGQRILAAEAERRVESNDLAGAERYWNAAIRISMNLESEANIFLMLPAVSQNHVIYTPMGRAFENGMPREMLARWQATLARVHRTIHRPGWMAMDRLLRYPAERKMAIEMLNQPWRSSTFQWDVNSAGKFYYYHFDFHGADLPRLDRMVKPALRALRYKQNIETYLNEFDGVHEEAMRRVMMTWPERMRCGPFPWPKDNPLFKGDYMPRQGPLIGTQETVLVSETRLNLLRSAIECKLTSSSEARKLIPTEIKDRESPWRDPFTEKPLRASEGTTETLRIYSLGPDIVDDRARISYDPTNGTMSAGDVFIEMK